MWQAIWDAIVYIFENKHDDAPVTPLKPITEVLPPNPAPIMKTNAQKLYDTSVACLGTDMSPADIAPDSLACAESLNGVYLKTFGQHLGTGPALTSTLALYQEMVVDKRLQKVVDPLPGDIVISPTGYSSKNSPHGHCGIWGNFDVMSNNSDSGKWKDNYTHEAWYDVFSKELGFPVYFFRVL